MEWEAVGVVGEFYSIVRLGVGMVQTRRTGVFLHTGNPILKARTPLTVGREVKGSGVWDPEGKRASGPKPKSGKESVRTARTQSRAVCAW
ncbi:hypothetical protein GCM10027068_46140 [Prescottella soli]